MPSVVSTETRTGVMDLCGCSFHVGAGEWIWVLCKKNKSHLFSTAGHAVLNFNTTENSQEKENAVSGELLYVY